MADLWDPDLYGKHEFVWQKAGDLLDLLEPRAGERILDLGCGTGELTARIAACGANVTGLDSSASMLAKARQQFPTIPFVEADARSFSLPAPVDAVFSNAVLHWIREPRQALLRIAENLRPGGRFVAEFGGRGNIRRLVDAFLRAVSETGFAAECPWYFPGVAEYAALLEAEDFDIRSISLFDRWTELSDAGSGVRDWMRMFGQPLLAAVPVDRLDAVLARFEELARPSLFRDGRWWADYRRLRVVALR